MAMIERIMNYMP